jgi:lipopolysaccharide export LptBFGC system permease protein LptF
VARLFPLAVERIVERIAELSAPRHRELVRGMVSELECITDRAERRRFAWGAIAAILRLALSGYGANVHTPDRFAGFPGPDDGAHFGGPSMPAPTTSQLLRRHLAPFAVSLTALTLLLLTNYATRLLPQLSAKGASQGSIIEGLLLAVPFTVAMTIPMAVFLAVSWVFARLGAEGVLRAAQRERHGVRRLVVPVLGAAATIAALTLVSNTQILPRTNARLAAVLHDGALAPTDRTMTVAELREAARSARAEIGADGPSRAIAYEVEIQKKFALAAACVVLASLGAAIAIRFPRGGGWRVVVVSGVVFGGYYVSLVAGEGLADRQFISPVVAMWWANALLMAVALALAWSRGSPRAERGAESLAMGS